MRASLFKKKITKQKFTDNIEKIKKTNIFLVRSKYLDMPKSLDFFLSYFIDWKDVSITFKRSLKQFAFYVKINTKEKKK